MASVLINWLLIFGPVFFPDTKSSFNLFERHPYFVSVTEVNHNSKEKIIEVSCKIFTNDLENILRQKTKGAVDILHPKDKTVNNKLIADYLDKNVQIFIDGRNYKLEFLGYEIEDEAVWSYLQIKNISSVKNIKVNDTILYDYKKEEINLLHVSVNGVRKSTKLTNPETTALFEF